MVLQSVHNGLDPPEVHPTKAVVQSDHSEYFLSLFEDEYFLFRSGNQKMPLTSHNCRIHCRKDGTGHLVSCVTGARTICTQPLLTMHGRTGDKAYEMAVAANTWSSPCVSADGSRVSGTSGSPLKCRQVHLPIPPFGATQYIPAFYCISAVSLTLNLSSHNVD